MITVTVQSVIGRDEAEAATPEDAVFAARTMYDEQCAAHPIQGFHRTIQTTFIVDGKVVRSFSEGTRP